MDTTQGLKKNLGFMTATSIVVGCVIGAGVFFKPYAIYRATGGAPGMGILSWIIVIILLVTLNCMGSRTAGGMQVISTACKRDYPDRLSCMSVFPQR